MDKEKLKNLDKLPPDIKRQFALYMNKWKEKKKETTERAIFFDSNEFADSITITIGGSASTIKGIFDNEMTTIDVGDNAGITANQPKITVKTSDITNADFGDPVVINSTNYTVNNVLKDGTGITEIFLSEA